MRPRLFINEQRLAICRLSAGDSVPDWSSNCHFFSVTKTADEISVVCDQGVVPDDVVAETDWQAIKVEGPLELGLTGILASIAAPLAQAGISIFAMSTYDTDYILVKSRTMEQTTTVLTNEGFVFVESK